MADILLPANVDISTFIPTNFRVLILPADQSSKSSIIVESDRFKPEPHRGTILKVADGVEDVYEVRPGMEVLFSQYAQQTLDMGGNTLFLVHGSDIVAVLDAGADNARLRNSP